MKLRRLGATRMPSRRSLYASENVGSSRLDAGQLLRRRTCSRRPVVARHCCRPRKGKQFVLNYTARLSAGGTRSRSCPDRLSCAPRRQSFPCRQSCRFAVVLPRGRCTARHRSCREFLGPQLPVFRALKFKGLSPVWPRGLGRLSRRLPNSQLLWGFRSPGSFVSTLCRISPVTPLSRLAVPHRPSPSPQGLDRCSTLPAQSS